MQTIIFNFSFLIIKIMFNKLFKNIFISWLTSLAGTVAGMPMILDGIAKKDTMEIIQGVALVIAGWAAKDSNVSNSPTPVAAESTTNKI